MTRILNIELRRSAALGTALVLFVTGVVLLATDRAIFTTGWIQLAMTQRLYLAVLWPLALAAGAWQASREHRSKVAELFTSTPRPQAHRVLPTLIAMAVAVLSGYLAMGVAGGLWIINTAEYLPIAALATTAVGVLALIAAVWFGLAIGRLLPWRVTAPALGIAGMGLLLLIPGATRPRGWLALVFSPIYEMNLPGPYTTVPGRAGAAQTLWLAALAVTALVLLASGGWRTRVAALLPVALGAALAIMVMPHQNRYVIDAIDPVARELVCTEDEPRVCVSRVHSGLLTEVTAPAREGLAVLAKLPDAPTTVHEDTTVYFPDNFPPRRADAVLLNVEAGDDAHLADRTEVRVEVVAGAFASPPDCELGVDPADRMAAAHWLIGSEPAKAGADSDPADGTRAVQLWNDLRRLPADKAKALVVALRQAAVNCTADSGLFPKNTP